MSSNRRYEPWNGECVPVVTIHVPDLTLDMLAQVRPLVATLTNMPTFLHLHYDNTVVIWRDRTPAEAAEAEKAKVEAEAATARWKAEQAEREAKQQERLTSAAETLGVTVESLADVVAEVSK